MSNPPSKNTSRMRSLAEQLDDADEDDEITGQTHIHVNGSGPVLVSETGRFQALEGVTKPDNPKPDSGPPKAVKSAVSILDAVNSWPKAFALAVLAALVGFAIWKGLVTGIGP